MQDALDDLDAGEVDVFDRGQKRALAGEQVVERGFAVVLALEIGGRAHDDDSAKVDEMVDGASQQGFECGVLLLRGAAV